MKRREFTLALGAGSLPAVWTGASQAQAGPVEGKEFTRLQPPVPPGAPAGKVEALEFFGYWCPHCHAFEPTLEAWVRKLPSDVVFRRVPVAFGPPHEAYQKLFYALEALGQLDAMHQKVFNAIHLQKLRLDKDADLQTLAKDNNLDFAKLKDTMNSFSVATKSNQAKQLANNYKLDGVPTLAVHGRFVTSVAMAGGHSQALQVMDSLIQRVRKG
jgi:protein dithiol oxidoreductase (disulfide-forming)